MKNAVRYIVQVRQKNRYGTSTRRSWEDAALELVGTQKVWARKRLRELRTVDPMLEWRILRIETATTVIK